MRLQPVAQSRVAAVVNLVRPNLPKQLYFDAAAAPKTVMATLLEKTRGCDKRRRTRVLTAMATQWCGHAQLTAGWLEVLWKIVHQNTMGSNMATRILRYGARQLIATRNAALLQVWMEKGPKCFSLKTFAPECAIGTRWVVGPHPQTGTVTATASGFSLLERGTAPSNWFRRADAPPPGLPPAAPVAPLEPLCP